MYHYANNRNPSNPKQSIENTKNQAISGAIWLAATAVLSKVSTLIALVFTGALLSKEDFAVYAFCYSTSAIFFTLRSGGVNRIIIQKPRLMHKIIPSAYRYSLVINGLGVLFGFSLILFFNHQLPFTQVLLVGLTLSLRALLSSPINIFESSLSANLQFKPLSRVRVTSVLLRNVLAVSFATLGLGPHSLSLPMLCTGIYEALRYYYLAAPRIKFRSASKRVSWWLFSQARWLLIVSILTASIMNVDYFLLGQFAKPVELAVYYFSFQLTASVWEMLITGIETVMMPTLVSFKSQGGGLINGVKRAGSLVNAASLPLGIALALTVSPAVIIIWGDKWVSSIKCAEILSLAIVPRSYVTILIASIDSLGKWKTKAKMLCFDLVGTGIASLIGILIFQDIFYVALLILFHNSVYCLIWCRTVAKTLDGKFFEILKPICVNLLIILIVTSSYLIFLNLEILTGVGNYKTAIFWCFIAIIITPIYLVFHLKNLKLLIQLVRKKNLTT